MSKQYKVALKLQIPINNYQNCQKPIVLYFNILHIIRNKMKIIIRNKMKIKHNILYILLNGAIIRSIMLYNI